jgi:hypothetical protein
VFNDVHEFLQALIDFLNAIQSSELQFIFRHWTERTKWVLANNGDYYHGEKADPEFAG